MDRSVDARELALFSALLALCTWIPLPVVDRWVMNAVRRAHVRRVARARGVELSAEDVAKVADEPGGGCAGCLLAVVWWPIKKIFKSIVTVFQFKEMADVASSQAHRVLMLEDAIEHGVTDAARIRAAMDRVEERVRIYPVERSLWGGFVQKDHAWNDAVERRAGIWRSDAPKSETASARFVSGSRVLYPDALAWFRQELGIGVQDRAVDGPVDPEVLPAEPSAAQITERSPMTDAEVVDAPTEEIPK